MLVDQAADRFAAPAEARSLSLQVRHDASGVTLSAPPEWLDQLVGVLLDNACKYSPVGGSVVVSVASADRRARLTVDDSGPGIPADRRDQVFDRFHRDTERTRRGRAGTRHRRRHRARHVGSLAHRDLAPGRGQDVGQLADRGRRAQGGS